MKGFIHVLITPRPRISIRWSQEHPMKNSDAKSLIDPGRQMLNKVPEVTLFFWVIKVLCTTVGETFADFLNTTLFGA